MGNKKYSYNIDITNDKMKAYITISENNDGEYITKENILNYLKKLNITYGIKYDVIENLQNKFRCNEKTIIAEGKMPIDGIDGKLDFIINLDYNISPKILKNGNVDYKEINFFKSVKKDQALVKRIDAKDGKDGINIYGEKIFFKRGREAKLPNGKNTYINGDILYSSIDGCVSKKGFRIDVNPLIEIDEVNTTIGNIKTYANIRIYKNVNSGFTIESDGDIEIFGVVEGAKIKAKGNIIIHNGIQGNGKAKLISGGNIVAKYVQNCDMDIYGDLTTEAIMFSNIKSHGSIRMIGKKGIILGSTIIAQGNVDATNIGSKMYTSTILKIGMLPEKREKKENILKKIKENQIIINKLNNIIAILERNGEKDEIYIKTNNTLSKMNKEMEELYNKYNEMTDTKDKINSIITVRDTIYPGTKITINDVSFTVNESINHSRLINIESEIKVIPI